MNEYWTLKKPKLSAKSVKIYSVNTGKIFNLLDIEFSEENISELVAKRHDLFSIIGEYNVNTAKNYYNTMAELVRVGYTGEDKEKAVDDIVECRNSCSAMYHAKVKNHEYSEIQKKKVIDWDEVLSVRENLTKQLKKEEIRRKIADEVPLTDGDLLLFQDLVLVSLYTYLPPVRNDYANLKVIRAGIYNSLTYNERHAYNYLVVSNRDMRISLSQFKTSKTHGTICMVVPKPLKVLLRLWLRVNESGILLLNRKNEPLSENGITKHLNRIFLEHSGKAISSTMLRHIFLSSKYGEDIREELEKYKEKKSIADSMGHSVLTQNNYVKLLDTDTGLPTGLGGL
tara:strand:+ start:8502 stop:9524 length:1023 start_codon:yes stop_codon:yes gene_type:complete